jgi:hypothetical protein
MVVLTSPAWRVARTGRGRQPLLSDSELITLRAALIEEQTRTGGGVLSVGTERSRP